SRLSPIESASLNGLSPFESLTPALKTPSQSRTSPRHAAARSARRSTGATKTPPSAANAAAISVNDAECGPISSLKSTRRFPRSRASPGARSTGPLALRTEQTEAHEILDIENAGGPLAVDDDDAVDLEFLEELDRFVQHGFFADRDRILREADLAERLIQDRAAVLLQPAPQVAVGEDADHRVGIVDDRDRAEPRFRHADHRRRQRIRRTADRVLFPDQILDPQGHELRVLAELGGADVRQRVVAQALQNGERHRADVHAGEQRLPHVLRVPHRGEHHFRVVAVDLDDLDELLEELNRVVPLVLHAAGERADESGARLHRHVGLVQRVNEMDVDAMAAVGQALAGLHARVRDRHLEHRLALEPERKNPLRLGDDRVRRIAERLDLKLRDHLRQPHDRAVDIRDPVPMHERRRRGQTLHEAEIERGLDFLEINRVEIKIHLATQCACDTCGRTRSWISSKGLTKSASLSSSYWRAASQSASGGFGCASMNNPSTPAATPARAMTDRYCRVPPRGSLLGMPYLRIVCVISKTTG